MLIRPSTHEIIGFPMSMVSFVSRFQELALNETRSFIIPKGNKLLPAGEYGLLELFCDEIGCDCRRVIFLVVRSDHPDRVLATVNFGWETAEYYGKWIGDPTGGEDMVGASLEPSGTQSKHHNALLDLCRFALEDRGYLERIKRHYDLFRSSVAGSSVRA